MKSTTRVIVTSLLLLIAVASPAWAQAKSELTVALSSFSAETLDPALQGHNVKYYLSLMFDYLVGVTPDGQPSQAGGLASKWESSADHKRWTFHLRKGVKFHDGSDMSSEDVKFSLQRAMSKRSTTGYAGPLRTLIADIETPAPDRVVIVLKESTLIIPTYLSRSLSTEGMVLPKKYIEANGDDVFARKPVGTGPYKFVEQVVGSHIKMTAVDNHWRIGVPKYKNVTFKLVPEETTRIALLRRGEADMADPYDVARAKKLLADAGYAGGFTQDVYAFQLPGFAEGKSFAEAVAGYWEKIGVKSKLIPVDYPAFRKQWVDRKAPGAVGYYNIANRDWIGTYALLEKQAYTPSKLNDTVNDPEIDGMIAQVMRQTDREKINALMRNIYTRMRSEHHGVPVVYVHSPYATSKTLGKYNPGAVMYDLFIDELARK